MAVELASAYVSLVPSARGMGAALSSELSGPMDSEGREASRRFGAAFLPGLRTVALGASALLVGGVAAAFKIGSTFDDAFDTIRVGTGATGEALEALKDDFRAVAADTPATFDQVSTAIADLNTRLGLTGEPLQDLAQQFLDLSRITGTDLSSNIEGITRLFGDWGLEDQAGAMDALFRASQATGAGMDQLSRQAVQFGAPMRQLGFSFEETVALLGQFEKEGVNTELVMGSMRQALGRMARDGEPAIETFERVTQEIANAGSASEANAIALELFGARAGPDMAAAIREGRFSIDELVETVTNGGETIAAAAEDTADFGESWQEFKNNVLLALEPVATRVFGAISTAMENFGSWWKVNGPIVTGHIETISGKIGELVSTVLEGFKSWWETNGPTVIKWAERIRDSLVKIAEWSLPKLDALRKFLLDNLVPALAAVATVITYKLIVAVGNLAIALGTTLLNPIGLTIAALALLAFGLMWAWQNSETFRNVAKGAFALVKGYVEEVLKAVGLLVAALERLKQAADFLVGGGAASWSSTLSNALENVRQKGGQKVPAFDTGGVMPGPRGVHSLAWVAGGETILPTHKAGWNSNLDVAPTGVVIDVTGGTDDLARAVAKWIRTKHGGNVQVALGGAR